MTAPALSTVLVLLQEPLELLGGLTQLGDKGEVAHSVLILRYETYHLGLCGAYLWVVNLFRAKRPAGRQERHRPAVASVVHRRTPLFVSANVFIGTISVKL
jgi:hypothetical protein